MSEKLWCEIVATPLGQQLVFFMGERVDVSLWISTRHRPEVGRLILNHNAQLADGTFKLIKPHAPLICSEAHNVFVPLDEGEWLMSQFRSLNPGDATHKPTHRETDIKQALIAGAKRAIEARKTARLTSLLEAGGDSKPISP